MNMPDKEDIQSAAKPSDFSGEYNALQFVIRQILGKANIATLVKIKKVTNAGGVAPVGFVDVELMLELQDGAGKVIKDGQPTLHKIPHMRIQGGTNAIILDPVVGDIGICLFADKDISVIKATKNKSSAGSSRKNSLSDGLYMGGVLNATPVNYVQFNGNDINVTATGNVNLKAPAINLKNAGSALQTLLNSTLLTWLSAHTHAGVTTGAGVTGVPVVPIPATVSTTITKAE
jgi:hypothetical protein